MLRLKLECQENGKEPAKHKKKKAPLEEAIFLLDIGPSKNGQTPGNRPRPLVKRKKSELLKKMFPFTWVRLVFWRNREAFPRPKYSAWEPLLKLKAKVD